MKLERVYSNRVRPLADRVKEEGLDALWVSSLVNIRYLTGFTGSFAQLLIAPSETILITDGRYKEQVQTEAKGCRTRVFEKCLWTEILAGEIEKLGWGTIGFESAHVSCELFGKVNSLSGLTKKVKWEATTGWVESRRITKDPHEIETLKRSSQIVDEVFSGLLPEFREGITEQEMFRKMMNLLWEQGASGASFDPIVLFGARSSLPHGKPGSTQLRQGDWVLLDFGALFEGYCSDCTRTFVFGEPDDLQRERHEIVKQAHDAGIQAARPGIPCKEVDVAAREVIAKAGLADAFIHGTGHGVGLEIHEAPRLATVSEEILEEGMVVTIEPGIYLPGWGGIRIEDAVVVGRTGAEPLTCCSHSITPEGLHNEPDELTLTV